MPKCSRCDRENPDDTEWCPGCGTVFRQTTISPGISEGEQIEALATRKLFEFVSARIGEEQARFTDLSRWLSVDRNQVAAFFRRHPQMADAHLIKEPSSRPYHDVICMELIEGQPAVFWLDHGKRVNVRYYESVEDAATDYVAQSYGYYYPENP